MTKLDTQTIAAFKNDGYLPAMPILGGAQVHDMRSQLEAFETRTGGPLKGSHRFKNHLLFKWLADLVRAPRILDMVESLIGPDIMVWSTDWWIKEPRSASFVSWHQDSHYWGLDTDKLVTIWIALSPSTLESGCMRVLPGSHLGPGLRHEDTYHDDNMLTRGQQITHGIDESKAVNLLVRTGECVAFAYRIAHASHPNNGDDRRIGLAIRYLPPNACQMVGGKDSAALVRGDDRFGFFDHEPYPSEDFEASAVAFHRHAEEVRRQILYHGTDWTSHRT